MKAAVLTSRNDDYGGNLASRAIVCLNELTRVFDEVVYVDWNSPGRVSLIDEIREDLSKTGRLNHVRVDSAFIDSLGLSSEIQPCCEVLARNVGFRRTEAEWVVSTNIDVFPVSFDESMLSRDTIYVVAKRNVPELVHLTSEFLDLNPQEKREFLHQNVETFKKWGEHHETEWPLIEGPGDYQVAHRDLWHDIRGFEESLIFRLHADTNVMFKAHHAGFKREILNVDIFHLDHKSGAEYSRKKSATRKNTWEDAVGGTGQTSNPDSWGFSDQVFFSEII